MLSAAFSRCSSASCSIARPIPELSFRTQSCIATIPIRAKETTAIQSRPRSSRSSRRWVSSQPSTPPLASAGRCGSGGNAPGAQARRCRDGPCAGPLRFAEGPGAGRTAPDIRRWRRRERSALARGAATVAGGGVTAEKSLDAGRSCPDNLRAAAQTGRGRARVALRARSRPGTIGLAGEERRDRRAPAGADGQVGRTDAAACELAHEALDAPVLERVEGDGREHAPSAQQVPGERQCAVELLRARR